MLHTSALIMFIWHSKSGEFFISCIMMHGLLHQVTVKFQTSGVTLLFCLISIEMIRTIAMLDFNISSLQPSLWTYTTLQPSSNPYWWTVVCCDRKEKGQEYLKNLSTLWAWEGLWWHIRMGIGYWSRRLYKQGVLVFVSHFQRWMGQGSICFFTQYHLKPFSFHHSIRTSLFCAVFFLSFELLDHIFFGPKTIQRILSLCQWKIHVTFLRVITVFIFSDVSCHKWKYELWSTRVKYISIFCWKNMIQNSVIPIFIHLLTGFL